MSNVVVTCLCYHFSSRWLQHDLQPAGAALHVLPGVAWAPAFGEAQPHGVRVKRAVICGGVTEAAVEAGQAPAEHLHREAGRDLKHGEGPRVGDVQGGGVDEDRDLTPVMNPHSSVIPTDDQT